MTDIVYDSNSLFARSWYAAAKPVANPEEALRLALRTLFSILNPDSNRIGIPFNRMLFAWDGAKKAHKNRQEKPEEYVATIAIFRDVISLLFNPAHFESPDYEADDIVATAVYKSTADEVYIVSGDKDLHQLYGPHTHYYCLNNKALLSEQFILSRWHVKHPSQVAIALAVIGDPTDGIKGIPKWGEKRCQKLFKSVTSEMDFTEALATIDAQVPDELKAPFYEALNLTLLETNVPGVPEPKDIEMAEPESLGDLLNQELSWLYKQLYRNYVLEPY